MQELIATDAAEWQRITSERFVPLECDAPAGRWAGRLRSLQLAPDVSVSRIASDAVRVERTPELIKASPSGSLLMTIQIHAANKVEQHGRTAALTPGDAVLYDASAPYRIDNPFPGQDQLVLRFDQGALAVRDGAVAAIAGRRISKDVPLLAAVRAAASAAWSTTSGPTSDGVALADALAGLVGLLVSGVAPMDRGSSRHASFLRSIAANCTDPEFDVAALARLHFTSVRTVYEAFAALSLSPADALRRARLRVARQELAAGRTVTETAAASGFGSVDTFIRSFRTAFGTTPARWSAQHAAR